MKHGQKICGAVNVWAQENKGVNRRGQHRISLCILQTYSPWQPFTQACIDTHRPQESEVSRKNEEDIKVNEQLNLEFAHRVFQPRPTTLLSIPWGLKMPRGASGVSTETHNTAVHYLGTKNA